jgi:lysophospholipase L1-like esterase
MTRVLTALIPLLFISHFLPADEPIRERIEWADIWVTEADKDDLPKVLLIGDSITRGYFAEVEKQLEGKAYCARLTTSKCVSDPWFPDEVQLLLKQYGFAVIHFNNGLHGWGYTEEQYKDGLLRLMETFEKHAPDAKLIWATTTPVRESNDLAKISERTERVKARNKIAAEIMQEQGIPTNDLYGLVEQYPDWRSGDGVHFNAKGKVSQAAAVAENVLKCLRITTTR